MRSLIFPFGASISRLSFDIECLPVVDTVTVLKKYNLLIQGSAFGVPFEERFERTYINYRPSSSSIMKPRQHAG